jgi:acetylornithine deacetylase
VIVTVLKAQEQKLLETVDRLADDVFDFTAHLVAEPSVLGREAAVVSVMADRLTALGYPPRWIPMDDPKLLSHPSHGPDTAPPEGRFNLAAVRPADAGGGRGALFNGHLDVVSAEPVRFWSRPPYEPVVEDGWMYGRGAGDMKSGVAAMTYAVHAVDRAGLGLRAPVTVNAVIEEECSGNGALASVLDGCDAEAVLIPEPFGPVRYIGQVGVMWFKVTVSGRSTHVLETKAGANAIEKCFPLIEALRRLETELNDQARPEPYQLIDHPLNLNVGIIKGGDWPSTVPSEATFHARLSFFPGTTYRWMRDRVTQVITEAAAQDAWLAKNPPHVEFRGFRSEGHLTEPDTDLHLAIDRCHQDLTGQPTQTFAATCTTDLRAFQFFGQGQSSCFGPVAENIHGADERVRLDSVIHTAKVYALFLARWCGVTE